MTRRRSLVLRLLVSIALVATSLAMPVGARAALIPTAVPIDSNFTVTDLNHGVTATDLANELVGGGVTVSNAAYTGHVRAAGTFTVSDPTTLGFTTQRGIVLSSGKVQTISGDAACSRGIEGPNNCHEPWSVPAPGGAAGADGGFNSTAFGTPGDAQLTALSGQPTFDAAILEFDFVPQFPTVQFKYVFSSEEYSDFANTSFNDVFGFFVNGTNCALVPGTSSPVAVDTVNNGNDQFGQDPTPHSAQFFRDNVRPAPSIDIQMDGLTTVFSCLADANPGVPNHMKLAIADAGDALYDSAVFLEGGSLISGTDTMLHGGGQSGHIISVLGGTAVTDSAKVTGANAATAAGTMTYNVYTHTSPGCTTLFASAGIKTVTSGVAQDSNPVTFTQPGTYDWVASYSGDPSSGNSPSANPCGSEQVTVTMASPTINTHATPAATAGATISDIATLAAGAAPTGTITFSLFGPSDAICASPAVATSTATVAGNGSYSSTAYTASIPGTYQWTASYSGDVQNNAVATACGDSGETSTVTKASPTLTTAATPAIVGGTISDSATLAGGAAPTGTITFSLFGPGDLACAGPAVLTSTATVIGNGTYPSGSVPATIVGSYHWVSSYSGDDHNNSAATHCGDAGETSAVTKASPALTTHATTTTIAGGTISDAATLTGGVAPTGTISFKLYGPADATCAGSAVFTSTATVNGGGTYASDVFTAIAAGAYHWVDSYSGDANNNAAVTACSDAAETSTVAKASPTLGTTASTATAGGSIFDTATLAGGVAPTGTITFNVYGPADATCAGPTLATSTTTVNGNGTYLSGSVNSNAAGSYHWVSSYSGDANNNLVATHCGDTGETSNVAKASPTISTAATTAGVGGSISDTATLGAGVAPTGTITFNLFGPADAACAATPVSISTVTVNGDGTYLSPSFIATAGGSYHWVSSYNGDANNQAVTTACGDAGETSIVTKASPTLTTAATSATAGGTIIDAATLAGGAAPTGSITFNLFGPTDPTCAGSAVFKWIFAPVVGDGTYLSGSFTAIASGSYHWVTSYGGDANNNTASTACGDAGETSVMALPTSTVGCDIDGSGKIVAPNGDKAKFVVDFGSEAPSANGEHSGNDEDSENGNKTSENVQTYRDLGPATPFTFVSTANLAATCNGKMSGSIYGTGLVNGTTPVSFIIDVTSGNAQEDGGDDREGHAAATYRIRLSNGYDSGVQVLKSGHISIQLESDEEDTQQGDERRGD